MQYLDTDLVGLGWWPTCSGAGWNVPQCDCEQACMDDTTLDSPGYANCNEQCQGSRPGRAACYATTSGQFAVCATALKTARHAAFLTWKTCYAACTTDDCRGGCGATREASFISAAATYSACLPSWTILSGCLSALPVNPFPWANPTQYITSCNTTRDSCNTAASNTLISCQGAADTQQGTDYAACAAIYDPAVAALGTRPTERYAGQAWDDAMAALDATQAACKAVADSTRKTTRDTCDMTWYANSMACAVAWNTCNASALTGRVSDYYTAAAIKVAADKVCQSSYYEAMGGPNRRAGTIEDTLAAAKAVCDATYAGIVATKNTAVRACQNTQYDADTAARVIRDAAWVTYLAAYTACHGDAACIQAVRDTWIAADAAYDVTIAADAAAEAACEAAANAPLAQALVDKNACYAAAEAAKTAAIAAKVGVLDYCLAASQRALDKARADSCSTDTYHTAMTAADQAFAAAEATADKTQKICSGSAVGAEARAACDLARQSTTRDDKKTRLLAYLAAQAAEMTRQGAFSGGYVTCFSPCVGTFYDTLNPLIGARDALLLLGSPPSFDPSSATAWLAGIAEARKTLATCVAACCNTWYGQGTLTEDLGDAVAAYIACTDANIYNGMTPSGFDPDTYSYIYPVPTDCETPWNAAVYALAPDDINDLCSPCLKVLHDIAATSSGGSCGGTRDISTLDVHIEFTSGSLSWDYSNYIAYGICGGPGAFWGVDHRFDQNLTPD